MLPIVNYGVDNQDDSGDWGLSIVRLWSCACRHGRHMSRKLSLRPLLPFNQRLHIQLCGSH